MADLSKIADAATLADQVRERHDHLDVVINNAGVFKTSSPITDDGLLTRQLYDERPLRVEYQLTNRGSESLPIVRSLKRCSGRHLHDIQASEERFEKHAPEAQPCHVVGVQVR